VCTPPPGGSVAQDQSDEADFDHEVVIDSNQSHGLDLIVVLIQVIAEAGTYRIKNLEVARLISNVIEDYAIG